MFKKIATAFGAMKYSTDNGKGLMTKTDYDFIDFVATHQKSYGTLAEYNFRKAQFAIAKQEINELNAKNGSATYGHNFMSDWTHDEYQKLFGFKPNTRETRNTVELDISNLPESINWVTKGAVTPVKDQGHCGASWTFSTTGVVEGVDQIAGGPLTPLSEAQLVDCSQKTPLGCSGSLYTNPFEYILKNPLESASDYPMSARGKCNYKKEKGVGHISAYHNVKPNSVEDLKAALVKGPVMVAIDASSMERYIGGVITSCDCDSQNLNHYVLAVGYDKSSNGTPYFLVKNSWGADWGIDGYAKLAAAADNTCGILSSPVSAQA